MLFKWYDIAKTYCGIGYESGIHIANETLFWR